jgi:hypothetical protein
LAKVLGVSDDRAGDDTALAAAVQGATPDQLFALKKADEDFQLQMTKLGFENTAALEALAAGDRASARGREVSVKDWTPRILAYFITAGFFGMLYWMMRHEIPATNKDMLLILLGSLGTAWIGVVTYYFGSSSGQDKATDLLHKSAPVQP